MPLQDGGVPAFLLGPLRPIGEVWQVAFFNHTVQGLVADIHLVCKFLNGDEYLI
jgi:hypothetical protein